MTSRPNSPRMTIGTADQEANVTNPEMRNAQVTTKSPASDRRARVAVEAPPRPARRAPPAVPASGVRTVLAVYELLSIDRGSAREDLDVAVGRRAHELVQPASVRRDQHLHG